MNIHEKYIKRCIKLAKNGLGKTYPNPMVGSVIVKKMTMNDGKTEQDRSIIIKEISDILSAMRKAMDS